MTADYDDVLMLAVATTIMNDCRNKSGEERLAAIVRHLAFVIKQERAKLAKAREIVDRQATDDGLWFFAEYITEARLQKALRELHAAIEGRTPDDCARAAIKEIDG